MIRILAGNAGTEIVRGGWDADYQWIVFAVVGAVFLAIIIAAVRIYIRRRR